MKYLVTGATGLLGNNLVRDLLARGNAVRVLVRSGGDPRPLAGLSIERAEGDIRDAAAVAQAAAGADVVIHSAGHVHIGWTQLDVSRGINVEGTRNVAAAARAAGARLVHVSTINALGLGNLDQPADEDTALPGILEVPYVVTKREAEKVVLDEVARGLWATIVHPATMFGPWDWKPSSGKMLLEVTRFAPWAPVGAQCFCDARDVSAGTIAAADRGQSGRRYILGGHNLSFAQAWRQIAGLVGKPGPRMPMGPLFRLIAMPALNLKTRLSGRETAANSAALGMGRQMHCFTSARAERELAYRIRPLDETLAAAWQWFCDNGYVKNARPKVG
jgi:dihydroflavonol-4-reductase